jgi:hypothetical protein
MHTVSTYFDKFQSLQILFISFEFYVSILASTSSLLTRQHIGIFWIFKFRASYLIRILAGYTVRKVNVLLMSLHVLVSQVSRVLTLSYLVISLPVPHWLRYFTM